MANKGRRGESRDEADRDLSKRDREGHRAREPYDDPAAHLDIERRRFAGGLMPTPELYALAREQWYQLPGVFVRPSMDPIIGDPTSGEAQSSDQTHRDGNGHEA
jgi:hypothetical protein